jgi:hypothetical protein
MSTAYHHLLEDESFSFGGISKTDVTTYAPWNEMLNRQTQGVWVTYGRDRPASEAARGWRISIQTKTDQVIHINPFEKTEGDDIVVAVQRPATDSNNEATQSEYQEMVSTAVCLVGRAVLPHTTVGDILNTIQRSGIANYRLKDKRGLSFYCINYIRQEVQVLILITL